MRFGKPRYSFFVGQKIASFLLHISDDFITSSKIGQLRKNISAKHHQIDYFCAEIQEWPDRDGSFVEFLQSKVNAPG